MKKLSSLFNDLSENHLIALITTIGVIIALRVIYIQHGWINNDSVLYFEVARLFANAEWKQGFALYNWPLYPALLAFIHKMTSLSIQHAAQLLNVIFFAITTYSFVTLIRMAGGSKLTLACGALLLFSSSYIVGDVLPMLLRDQGFWAFFLTSLIFFTKFYRDWKLSDALLWQLSAIIAMLFRVEAITFLFFLPCMILANTSMSAQLRLNRVLQASIITLAGIVIILVTLITTPSIGLADFGRIQEIASVLHIYQDLILRAQVMGGLVLGNYLNEYGLLGIILTMFGIAIVKIASTAGWVTVGLLTLTKLIKTEGINLQSKKIFLWAGVLALLNISIIILSVFVLSSRYIVALAFILLIMASFCLASLFNYWSTRNKKDSIKKWLLMGLLIILTLSFVKNILPKNPQYNYEQNAVKWVEDNSNSADKIFYTSPRARYYAGSPYTSRGYDLWDYSINAIETGATNEFDYLVINIEDDLTEKTQKLKKLLPDYRLAKEFFAPRNKKKIVIFVKNQ